MSWSSVGTEHGIPQHSILTVVDLHKQISKNQWMEPLDDSYNRPNLASKAPLGIVLQQEGGNYVAHPPNINDDVVKAVLRLDVPIAFTMSSEATAALAEKFNPDETLYQDPSSGITLPIVPSIQSLASGRAKIPQDTFVCYCRQEGYVLVWADSVSTIGQAT